MASVSHKIPVRELLREINELHLENLKDTEHTAYFVKTEHYHILIVRFFDVVDNQLKAKNDHYVMVSNEVYQFGIHDDVCSRLEDGFKSLYAEIENKADFAQTILSGYVNQVDVFEDSLYDRSISPTFMDHWFAIKRDISRMERIYARSIFVLNQFVKTYQEAEYFPLKEFEDVLEDMDHNQRICLQNLGKLDTLYNYYSSLKADKMNGNVYVLTVLSGIFLPLNLLVGFFGMNTQNLFLGNSPDGTWIVTYTLIGLFLFMLIGLPIVKWFESMIIKRLLGRYSFYRNISNHVKKMMDVDVSK